LDNETSYYLGDTGDAFDNPQAMGYSAITTIVAVLESVMSPGFYLSIPPLIVICHAFFYLFFASLLFSYHDVACLANVKGAICHSAFKECAKVDGTFVPTLIWSVQVHFC
jgi:hypothetical protein